MAIIPSMLKPALHENRLKRALVTPFRGIIKRLSPVLYVKLQYRYLTHRKLNLKNPVRYTEKLQHLRLYEYPNNPEVSRLASRLGARDYVKEQGYENILIPLLGSYSSFDEIDFEKLPTSFVLKCNHASGFNAIIEDKSATNIPFLRAKFTKWLQTDYGKMTIEPHYSPIPRKIVAEPLLKEDGHLPTEYKIHVFNGKARNLYVVRGRGQDIHYDQLYIDWTPFDASQFNGWTKGKVPPEKPADFEEMVEIAEKLAAPFPFVRVDLYSIDGHVYFSEMTFTPAKGTLVFDDDEADFIQGRWLNLPNAK